jgi:glycosyltransferase involved in cell wall biosynthesis
MRVLFLSSLDFKEKSIVVIRKTPEAYARAGWDVTYIVARDTAANGNYSYEAVIDPPGVKVIRFPWPLRRLRERLDGVALAVANQFSWYGVVLRLAWKGFWQARLRGPYDVLYGYEAAAVLAATMVRIGLAVTLARRRPRFVSRFMGVWNLNRYAEQKRYGRLALAFGWLTALWLPSDLCIMTNDGTQGLSLLKRLNSRRRNVKFFVNGVDPPLAAAPPDEPDWAGLGIQPSDVLIAAINRLAPSKRMDRCLRAFARIVETAPDAASAARLKLAIVGDGTERRRLEKLAAELGVDEQTVFTGAVRQVVVSRYLQRAECVFLFSTATNAGNGLLEAVRHRKIVFALDNGDTHTWIRHRENGFLLPEDDASLASSVAEEFWRIETDKTARGEMLAQVARLADERLWTWDERLAAELASVEALHAA